MGEVDALSDAKLGGGLFLNDFPVKVRVLTLDPVVHLDSYGNTRYAFIVLNLDDNKVQILDKGPGFAQSFKDIHTDIDFGSNLQGIDLKIKTNGKSGKETRYDINPVGDPHELSQEQLKVVSEAKINLDEVIKKSAPNAMRLSEINAGGKLSQDNEALGGDAVDVSEEDIDKPINLDEIPF